MGTIAILDSGVGGLSIYQEVLKKCPDNHFVFISDNQAFPYGTKTEKQLNERVTLVVARIVEQYSPDILIIACNTASTIVLPLLRQLYSFPIVGVVPAIKPAAGLSETGTIGLLATPGTISRAYTDSLIKEFAPNHTLIKVGSSALVQLAESKLRGTEVDTTLIEQELSPFIANEDIDTLVLACTHFPLLKNELIEVFNSHSKKIQFIDSGEAIANRTFELSQNLKSSSKQGSAVFTCINDSDQFTKYLSSIGLNSSKLLTI